MMARITQTDRNRRKREIWNIVHNGDGVTESEIEAETGIHRRTINNYLRELTDDGVVQRTGKRWYSLTEPLTELHLTVQLSAENTRAFIDALTRAGIDIDF